MAPKKAGPPQQIILGDAAPTPAEPLAAAGPVVKNPRLVKADGSLYMVQDGEQVVGREGGQLTLAGESSVSRSHAKISKTGDSITVEDMGSTNGTFVNGQKVSAPTPLHPGDAVQFGAVQYRYEE
jgi:predicted component of type VI protein secretion system